MFESLGNGLLAALGISFLIFIHELGHFVAARMFGVRVETFSVGFGPRLWGVHRGGTDYRLSAIPLGGYVKMAGEYGDYGDDVELAPDDLNAKPAWQRAVIFSGGVIFNFVFAFVAFPIVFALGVPFTAPVTGSVLPGGAAWHAGLEPGDEILTIEGRRVYEFAQIPIEVALGDPEGLAATVRRDGRVLEVVLVPTRNELAGRWEVGVGQPLSDVLGVVPDGPAARAGLQDGDVLVGAGDLDLTGDPSAFSRLLEMTGTGTPIPISVEREGERLTVSVTPEERVLDTGTLRIGVLPAMARVVGLRNRARTAAGEHPDALMLGDVVLEVAGTIVTTGDEVMVALAARADQPTVPLTIRRRDEVRTLAMGPAARDDVLAGDVAFGTEDRHARVRVLPGGAVADAGLADGDEVRALDGQSIAAYSELVTMLLDSDQPRHSLRYWRRPQQVEQTLAVEARPPTTWDLGIVPSLMETHYEEGLLGSMVAGFDTSVNGLRTTWLTLTKLISGDVGTKNMSGIVGIGQITYAYAGMEFAKLLFFLALLSINLGIINILPIPVLDGGQLMFLLFEKVKGSRLSERFLNGAQLVGLFTILALVVYVTYNDIQRLIFGP